MPVHLSSAVRRSRPSNTFPADADGLHAVPASSLLLVAILMLVWGCNWPVLKVGVTELAPLRKNALEDHPWRDWAEAQEDASANGKRMPGATSRWNRGKDLSWEPLSPERVCEVAYDHMQGTRFRHAAQFVRWRPDRDPRSGGPRVLEEIAPRETHGDTSLCLVGERQAFSL